MRAREIKQPAGRVQRTQVLSVVVGTDYIGRQGSLMSRVECNKNLQKNETENCTRSSWCAVLTPPLENLRVQHPQVLETAREFVPVNSAHGRVPLLGRSFARLSGGSRNRCPDLSIDMGYSDLRKTIISWLPTHYSCTYTTYEHRNEPHLRVWKL